MKIGHFGLATVHRDCDDVNEKVKNIKHIQLRSTIGYIAPEVNKTKEYDERCDLYSLGIIYAIYFVSINSILSNQLTGIVFIFILYTLKLSIHRNLNQ